MEIEKDDDVIVGDLKLGWSFDLQGARKVWRGGRFSSLILVGQFMEFTVWFLCH